MTFFCRTPHDKMGQTVKKKMSTVPRNLEETIDQAKEATQLALEAGINLLQVELLIPEIALQAQSLARQFLPLFANYGSGLKVLFPDAGAAALARRDWGGTEFKISDLGSRNTPIEIKVTAEDQAFLVVCPSSVEVQSVEKLYNIAQGRPVVLLIPQLEDVAIVGIGYAARQLRERFLNTIESSYYIKPLESGIVLRSYPSLWQVWREKAEDYELLTEEPQKPVGDALEEILNPRDSSNTETPIPKKTGLFISLNRFLKALSQ
jgi:hypothetical protein